MCEQVKEFECLKETLDLAVMRGRMILLLHDEDLAREYLADTEPLYNKLLYPPQRLTDKVNNFPSNAERYGVFFQTTANETATVLNKESRPTPTSGVCRLSAEEAKDMLKVTLPKRTVPLRSKKEPSPKVGAPPVKLATEDDVKELIAKKVTEGYTAKAICALLSTKFTTTFPINQERVFQLVAMNKRRINRQKKENPKPEPESPTPEEDPEKPEQATTEFTQTTAEKIPDVLPMAAISTATRQSPSVLFARAGHEGWPYNDYMVRRDLRKYVVARLPIDIKTSVEKFFQ